ncbi:Uncharacterised protein [Leclercia adecarboxylata]|uniref:Uncharacterized protein n=1 Tax=Leclercia adecarboxylata TaxID=83655 RepID=A0A4V6JHP5_9ENTR|nr:Uncharacterised protein [Leclercia adecarboxylata]
MLRIGCGIRCWVCFAPSIEGASCLYGSLEKNLRTYISKLPVRQCMRF